MLRDTRTAFWLPFAHARHGSIARRRARTCWFVTGQWLHMEPTCVTWLLHCGLHCCFRMLFATYTLHCETQHLFCIDIWWTSSPGYEVRRRRRATPYFFRHHGISYGWLSNSSVGDSNYCYVIPQTSITGTHYFSQVAVTYLKIRCQQFLVGQGDRR